MFTANGTAAALDNLIITNGGITNGQVATSFGGAYVKSGSLTVNQCTISNNTAGSVGAGGITNPAGSTLTVNQSLIFGNGGIGGGIQNSGSLTVTSSTLANNSTTNSGGGLYNTTGGTATLAHVTIAVNFAATSGGGVDNAGTLNMSDTIVEANNTVGTYADYQGTVQQTNSVVNTNSSSSSNYTAATLGLVALGNYGGPTQTMPVMPILSSPVVCKDSSSTAPTAFVDQRGFQGVTKYRSVYCTDAGATNESYNLAWTTQPAASYVVGADFPTTGPILSFEDNGYVLPFTQTASLAAVELTDPAKQLNGTGSDSNFGWTNGVANFSTASIASVEPTDSLVGQYTFPVYPFGNVVSPASNSFAVVPLLAGLQITGLPTSAQAGGILPFQVTALSSLSPVTIATGYTGTVTFTSTDGAASLPSSYTFTASDAGTHSFASGVTFKTAAPAQTITVADNTASVSNTSNGVLVNAAAATLIQATGSTTIFTQAGTAFGTTALQVQVTDAYGNPKPTSVVLFSVQTAVASATLSSSTCVTNSSGICAVTATANNLAGVYTITASLGTGTPVIFNATNTGVANFFVTVFTDASTGVASHCTEGGSTDPNCSLRDALAAAAAIVNSQVSAYVLVGAHAPLTIQEVNNTLTIPPYTNVSAPISNTGTNLVTVTGNGSTPVFTVASGSTFTAINNLTITGGGGTQGGGISNSGVLTVNNSTIETNSVSTGNGGGIWNAGTLTVNGSTFFNNGAGGAGGAIYSTGTLNVNSSTLTNNGANGNGGAIDVASGTATLTHTTITGNNSPTASGIFNGGALTLSGSVVAANSVVDILGSYTAGAVANVAPPTSGGNAAYTSAQLALAPLGFYGGYTQTMPALPGGPAFCIVLTTTAGTASTDQRGVAVPTKYGTSYCTDAGATNSKFSLAWTTQPADTYFVSVPLATLPVVQLEDNGYTIPSGSGAAASTYVTVFDISEVTTGCGYVSHVGINLNLSTSGSATFPSACTFGSVASSDNLTAEYGLNFPGGSGFALSGTSNGFNVVPNVVGFTISALPAFETAGTAETFVVTALSSLSPATTATNYTGTVTFTSTDGLATLPASYTFTNSDAGVHNFSNGLIFKTAGAAQTITVADTTASVSQTSNNVAVNAAQAAYVYASGGNRQSTVIGQAFSSQLTASVSDIYGNPVGGTTVTFTPPSTGASAILTPGVTCTTSTTTPVATCSVTATANGLAGGPYNVTASIPSANVLSASVGGKAPAAVHPESPASPTFSLTNLKASPSLTVTASPTTLVYGQPVTITATSSPLSAGGSYPTGAVTFYDNTTTLTPTSAPASGVATYATYALAGAQTYAAASAGDANFNAVNETSATTITVAKATPTLTGPTTQPVFVVYGNSGSIPVSVAIPYTPSGSFAGPSGGLGYSIVPAAGGSAVSSGTTSAISGGGASIPVANTLAAGLYNVTVTYAGDSNFNAATSILISLQIGQLTPVLGTVSFSPAATETYGTSAAVTLSTTLTFTGPTPTGAVTFALNGVNYTANCGTTSPANCTATVPAATIAALPAAGYTVTSAIASSSVYYAATGTSATFTVTQATQTITFSPATPVTYGIGPITLTATGGGSSNAVTYTLVSGPATLSGSTLSVTGAGSIVVKASQAGSTNYLAATPVTATIVVNPATTSVGLTTSQSPAFVQTTVTLTATVTSAAGAPPNGELVSFYDTTTSTSLGQAPLAGGVATLPTSSLAAGTHAITATYSGDTNLRTSTSTALSQVLQDFTLTLATTTGSVTTATIPPGGTATYQFSISMINNVPFPAAVALTAVGAPTGATITFTPAVIPAGSTSTPVTLTILVPKSIAAQDRPARPGHNPQPFTLALLLFPLAVGLGRSRKQLRRALCLALLLVAGLGATVGLSGCGVPTGYFNQAPQTYTVLVTGASGSLSHAVPVTLTVE